MSPWLQEIRNGMHRRLLWHGNHYRVGVWRIRKAEIGHTPAPVLVERWTPSLLWRVRRWMGWA